MPANVPAQARTALGREISFTAAHESTPVMTAIAVATRNVIESSGAAGAFARRTISTKPVFATLVA